MAVSADLFELYGVQIDLERHFAVSTERPQLYGVQIGHFAVSADPSQLYVCTDIQQFAVSADSAYGADGDSGEHLCHEWSRIVSEKARVAI